MRPFPPVSLRSARRAELRLERHRYKIAHLVFACQAQVVFQPVFFASRDEQAEYDPGQYQPRLAGQVYADSAVENVPLVVWDFVVDWSHITAHA